MSAPGFTVDAMGVWKESDKDATPKSVAPAPINICEVGTDPAHVHYVTVRWMYGKQEQRRTVPRALIAGPDLLTLASYGAPITQATRAVLQIFLQRQEQYNLNQIAKIKVFTEFGWTPDLTSFVLGERVLGAEGRSLAVADKRFMDALHPSGDIKRYEQLCSEVRNASPVAEAAWAAGYVGPILRLLGERSRVLSSWGTSLNGKSATQAIAVSPWGRPEHLKLTGDATPTAIEANLTRCRDLIVWMDDTQQTRNKDLLEALAYQIGGGTGRARGTVTGGLRQINNWLAVATSPAASAAAT